ncbi:hypothetical protein NDU88_007236 [Pleurodeles waltl]|uniref:Uncharacterized protein n=1 Tax=Pleurodeles waltl TaxID=8319 RepID=A0AAV7U0N9_PLEWA|nr:hypothetical protein NDU88_007236 [Pleurodeles waltl]
MAVRLWPRWKLRRQGDTGQEGPHERDGWSVRDWWRRTDWTGRALWGASVDLPRSGGPWVWRRRSLEESRELRGQGGAPIRDVRRPAPGSDHIVANDR